MTCVIALKHENKVYMGGDTYLSGGNSIDTKIVKFPSNVLVGFAGSRIVQNLLCQKQNSGLFVRNMDENNDAIDALLNALRLINPPTELYGTLLLLSSGKHIIYMGNIAGWYRINSTQTYECIGDGAQTAKGAMHCMDDKILPKIRIERALQSAEQWCPSVRGPFTCDYEVP